MIKTVAMLAYVPLTDIVERSRWSCLESGDVDGSIDEYIDLDLVDGRHIKLSGIGSHPFDFSPLSTGSGYLRLYVPKWGPEHDDKMSIDNLGMILVGYEISRMSTERCFTTVSNDDIVDAIIRVEKEISNQFGVSVNANIALVDCEPTV